MKNTTKMRSTTLNLKLQTEKALKVINQYQKLRNKNRQQKTITLMNFKQAPTFSNYSRFLEQEKAQNESGMKQFHPREVIRIQLLPYTSVQYKIRVVHNLESKLVIRNYRGIGTQLSISYLNKNQKNQLNKINMLSSKKYLIHDQVLIKLNKERVQKSQYIIFTFQSDKNLEMLSFRMDLLKDKKRLRALKTQKSNQSLLTLEHIDSNIQKKILNESEKERQVDIEKEADLIVKKNIEQNQLVKLKKQRIQTLKKSRSMSLKLKPLFLEQVNTLKPELKKKKMEQIKQVKEQKQIQAKVRKQNAQVLKYKEIQARQLSLKCKKQVQEYQELVKQQSNIKNQLLKRLSPLFYLAKFVKISNSLSVVRQNESQKIFMIQLYVQRFKRKMLRIHSESENLLQNFEHRQENTFLANLSFQANVLNRNGVKKSDALIVGMIKQCMRGIILNQAMNYASKYRRYIRHLQRSWRSKYQARTKILTMYMEEQLIIIFKSYPHLKELQGEYRKRKIQNQICHQYQMDCASKMKDLNSAYEQRLLEIQQYKKINEQIKEFNKTAMKKRQKQLLQIPKTPARPQPRFFRDLLFLKSMIRGWFQVQYRKQSRLNKKQKKTEEKVKQTNKKL